MSPMPWAATAGDGSTGKHNYKYCLGHVFGGWGELKEESNDFGKDPVAWLSSALEILGTHSSCLLKPALATWPGEPCCGPSLHQIIVRCIIHFDLQEVKEEISVRCIDQTRHTINFIPAYSHWTSLLLLLSLLGQSVIFDTIQNKAWGSIAQCLDCIVEKCLTRGYYYSFFPVSFGWTVQGK